MPDPQSIRQSAIKRFRSIFSNFIRGGFLKYHKDLKKDSALRVKDKLQNEFDKRLTALSAVREFQNSDAIEKMLRSFSGWATSITPETKEQADVHRAIKIIFSSMKQAANDQRDTLRDQGHKLENALSGVVAKEFGALAGVWHSRWREEGYKFRAAHKQLDEKIFLFSNTWATKHGMVKPGVDGWAHDHDAPGMLPNCKCSFRYIYSLKDLPEDMLTVRGKQALAAESIMV